MVNNLGLFFGRGQKYQWEDCSEAAGKAIHPVRQDLVWEVLQMQIHCYCCDCYIAHLFAIVLVLGTNHHRHTWWWIDDFDHDFYNNANANSIL